MPRTPDVPDIESMDDIITRDELIAFFGVVASSVDHWRYGYKDWPLLPYLRIGRRVYFSKRQVVWWMNEMQKLTDIFHSAAVNRRKGKK